MTYRAGSSWRNVADTWCPGARREGAPSRIPVSCRCRGSGGDSHYPKSDIRDLGARSAAPGVGVSRYCSSLHHQQMVGRRSPPTRRPGHPRHPAAAWWRPPIDCSHLQANIHVCRLRMGISASTRNAYSWKELLGKSAACVLSPRHSRKTTVHESTLARVFFFWALYGKLWPNI
jgi:hypothetical protein